MSELYLERYNGSQVVLDFSDIDSVTVSFESKAEPLNAEEANEINKFIERVDSMDFFEVELRLSCPIEMEERIGGKLYMTDVANGSLILLEERLFYISNDMKVDLRRHGKSKISSNLGEEAEVKDFVLSIGEFKLPYVFDYQYLLEYGVPSIVETAIIAPLQHNIRNNLYYNKFINEDGALYLFTKEPDTNFVMHIPHNSASLASVATLLSLLGMGSCEDLTTMLS